MCLMRLPRHEKRIKKAPLLAVTEKEWGFLAEKNRESYSLSLKAGAGLKATVLDALMLIVSPT